MNIVEILLIGVALSMDAAAVSMTNGMVFFNSDMAKLFISALMFGIFQAVMPLLGYYTGSIFGLFIERYSGIIALVILGFIGGNMIKEGFGEKHEEHEKVLLYKTIAIQAFATSIDAFMVGITFIGSGINVFNAVILIGVTTVIISIISLFIGKKLGDFLGSKAEIAGGIVLILIGIKSLLGSII